ncbi:MAG TPA: MerR family transcriptional regulator [Nitrospina sp.]|nr:MerR family transcriptional regulator [Nitrospina sp.]
MNVKLKRGELAKKCGIHIATLRYYEKCRLLNPPPRSKAGYRLYSEKDITKIHFIKNAQKLGFSLKEISELIKLRVREGKTCDPVLKKTQNKLGAVEQKIKNLKSMRKVLKELINKCNKDAPTSECPILDSFDSENESQ